MVSFQPFLFVFVTLLLAGLVGIVFVLKGMQGKRDKRDASMGLLISIILLLAGFFGPTLFNMPPTIYVLIPTLSYMTAVAPGSGIAPGSVPPLSPAAPPAATTAPVATTAVAATTAPAADTTVPATASGSTPVTSSVGTSAGISVQVVNSNPRVPVKAAVVSIKTPIDNSAVITNSAGKAQDTVITVPSKNDVKVTTYIGGVVTSKTVTAVEGTPSDVTIKVDAVAIDNSAGAKSVEVTDSGPLSTPTVIPVATAPADQLANLPANPASNPVEAVENTIAPEQFGPTSTPVSVPTETSSGGAAARPVPTLNLPFINPLESSNAQQVELNVVRHVSFVTVHGDDGKGRFYTTVTLELENNGNGNTGPLNIREHFPKALNEKKNKLVGSSIPLRAIEDPNGQIVGALFEFKGSGIPAHEKQVVTYTFEGKLQEGVLKDYNAPVAQVSSKAVLQVKGAETKQSLDQSLLALGLALVVVGSIIALVVRRKPAAPMQ